MVVSCGHFWVVTLSCSTRDCYDHVTNVSLERAYFNLSRMSIRKWQSKLISYPFRSFVCWTLPPDLQYDKTKHSWNQLEPAAWIILLQPGALVSSTFPWTCTVFSPAFLTSKSGQRTWGIVWLWMRWRRNCEQVSWGEIEISGTDKSGELVHGWQ
jgi:hypothetical protein